MSETTTAKAPSRTIRPHTPESPRDDDIFPTSAVPPPSTPRRRRTTSDVSASSRRNSISLQEAKSMLHNTTQSVLAPTDTENPTWHSIPLAFAVLPAVGGVLFTGGHYFITDVMLLFLVAVFLHWLVKFPWEWYHSSQVISAALDASEAFSTPPTESESAVRAAAAAELRFHERVALLSCFGGPLVGGWLLHAIRSQLSRPSEGIISNFNLTIFVLAAELRPVAQVVKLVRARTLHLQSIVHHPPPTRVDLLGLRVTELHEQVRELTALTAKAVERGPDLDALNRAVRRYEKKEAIHSANTETRILEIDSRLNDVLTLAAAASARQQETTISVLLLEWVCAVVVIPFTLAWRLVSLPARAVETLSGLRKSNLLLKRGMDGQRQSQRLRGRTVRGKA